MKASYIKNPILIGVIVLVVGALAFLGGMKYQQAQKPSFGGGQFAQGQRFGAITGLNGENRQQQRARTGGMVMGEIIGQDDKSITVKLPDGSSKIVLLSETTTISKASEGTKSDLKNGENVRIFGTINSDGTVTAQNIQLNPINRGATNGGPPGL